MSPHRANIINTLQLIASREDQLEYQEKAPVNVATELINQWFDDFYHPADEGFQTEFSSEELCQLAQFNEFYDRKVESLPDTLAELHESSAWAEIMALASEVLRVCGWAGVEARYDR